MSTPFPRIYLILRHSELVQVTVENRDQLRALRTELELLRRLRRLIESNRFAEVGLSESKYTSEDRAELMDILRDARHDTVEQSIASVDQEFDDLRKEILMSAVNEQAETLAHEAAESGALEVFSADAGDVQPVPAPSVEDALAAAEVELAKVVAMQTSQTPDEQPLTIEDGSTDTPKATTFDAPIDEPAPAVIPPSSPIAVTPSTKDLSFSPDRAELVVAEIESGIRKLASILSNEVNDQWKHAETALHEVIAMRTRVQQTAQNATGLFSQIAHLKEEVEIARDDAEVARREAKLLRDDARRAKERAEAAAAACIAAQPTTTTTS